MKKNIAKVIHEKKMVVSFSEARRLISMGVVEVNGEKVVSLDKEIEDGDEVKVVKVKK